MHVGGRRRRRWPARGPAPRFASTPVYWTFAELVTSSTNRNAAHLATPAPSCNGRSSSRRLLTAAGVTRVCHIQRSCGYALRRTLTVAEIGEVVTVVRAVDASIVVTVDNCYGEFTEVLEPGHAGADLIMGSMIKNPGGTLAAGTTLPLPQR